MAKMNSDVEVTTHAGDDGLLETVLPLYTEVYAEPPYNEGLDDVEDFIRRWNLQIRRPGFRLALAHRDNSVVGFSFGLPLTPDTHWWDGLLDPVDEETTREYPGRSFVIIELAVLLPYRRRGIGRALHRALLQQRPEQRVTLASRAEAAPAQAAYAAWGYQAVGRVRSGPDVPEYVVMLRPLPINV
jgi:ribosomal protein S18 acetylase RimI-like enzyme